MRRAAPELVGLPFLNDVWSPVLAAGSPIELAADRSPSTSSRSVGSSPDAIRAGS